MYTQTVVDCGDLQPPTSGMVDLSNGTTFGSRAIYSCNDFFQLNDSSIRVCQENGQWSGTTPVCNCEYLLCVWLISVNNWLFICLQMLICLPAYHLI